MASDRKFKTIAGIDFFLTYHVLSWQFTRKNVRPTADIVALATNTKYGRSGMDQVWLQLAVIFLSCFFLVGFHYSERTNYSKKRNTSQDRWESYKQELQRKKTASSSNTCRLQKELEKNCMINSKQRSNKCTECSFRLVIVIWCCALLFGVKLCKKRPTAAWFQKHQRPFLQKELYASSKTMRMPYLND